MEPPRDMGLSTKRHKLHHPISGVSYERPGGDEHPPGDVSHMGSILVFWDPRVFLIGKEEKWPKG